MVVAKDGSTCGLTVVVSIAGGMGVVFLSQEINERVVRKINKIKTPAFFIIILTCNKKIKGEIYVANLLQAEESARNI